MALGIRGSNPIWSEFDLTGHLFDDTFYLFVLQNTIPYIPATVYHDPDLNTPWTNPIQFLANGTLPNDIYFESEVVYRLEFRQGPTQADPLIYEVNNYVAGSGGSTPVDTVAFASSNQITNPQFSRIDFISPYTVSATNPDPIDIGPGWFLELTGTGTVTITQVPLNSSNQNPSNAPYALRLTMTGWDVGGVFLRQRFQQNGMLWANKIVSSTVTARVQGAPQNISASLVDSNAATLTQVLPLTTVNESFNEFTGYGELGASTNPDVPPAAYIDYKLSLPNNVDIYLSSFQLVVQELPIEPSFEQDSIERQIDHTYHADFPIVPVGTIIDWYGFYIGSVNPVPHYLPCNGEAISRTQYQLLFNTVTHLETVTLTSGSPTITVSNATIYATGYAVEGVGIPPGTTILSVTLPTTITLSANATAPGSSQLRFFAVGAGNGSTTFNLPDLRGLYLAGSGSTTLLAAPGTGQKGGAATHALTINEMPAHNHPGSTAPVGGGGGGAIPTAANISPVGTTPITIAAQGGGVPFSILPPTALSQKLIRFE